MRTNDRSRLVHVLTGLLILATSLECGKSDHVHLKIHIPNVIHKHKHIKTKFVHVFHPKVIHTDHTSLQFLHRHDPNIRQINGGNPQPLVNLDRKPELRITEEEFYKWREEQYQKALQERTRLIEEQQNNDEPAEEEADDENYKINKDEPEAEPEADEEELYKKHKANKANSSSSRKPASKHKNHNYQMNYNYNQDYEATNADKTYANYPSRPTHKRKYMKPAPTARSPTQTVRNPTPTSRFPASTARLPASTGRVPTSTARKPAERPRKTPPKIYGFVNQFDHEVSQTNLQPQYYAVDKTAADPTAIDPTHYSTLPKDQSVSASDNQDEIYSGLLSSRYTKLTVDKSKLLSDINYARKKQTRNNAAQRRAQ